MKFYVIAGDGHKYGPADIATLNQWVKEDRITRNSQLENAETGQRLRAGDVSGIDFSPDISTVGSEYQQPAAQANPYEPPGLEQSSALQQPPGSASPYPRPGVNLPGIPAECKGGFNFGAFFFTWIWGLNHRAYWTLWVWLAAFIPCGSIAFSIYCGIKGNEAAWNSGRFYTAQDCLACQKIWMWWGVGLLIFSTCGYGLFFFLVMGAGM
ncbi:MAG: hypothetical protein IH944_11110 [Armatimonadetes bacterium]|nr:hypothetical protein [Armatimonadota bacterium]